MKGIVLMAKKSNSPHTRKRLNPSKFKLEIASASQQDAVRYLTGRNRLVYSYEVIRDKHNTQQIQIISSRNLEIQRLSREFAKTSAESFFALLDSGTKIFFFVEGSIDRGFATVQFENSSTAYIGDLTVFRQLSGMGTLFYNMLEEHLRSAGITQITLNAPFDGCKVFWQRMGFTSDVNGISPSSYKKIIH